MVNYHCWNRAVVVLSKEDWNIPKCFVSIQCFTILAQYLNTCNVTLNILPENLKTS